MDMWSGIHIVKEPARSKQKIKIRLKLGMSVGGRGRSSRGGQGAKSLLCTADEPRTDAADAYDGRGVHLLVEELWMCHLPYMINQGG